MGFIKLFLIPSINNGGGEERTHNNEGIPTNDRSKEQKSSHKNPTAKRDITKKKQATKHTTPMLSSNHKKN